MRGRLLLHCLVALLVIGSALLSPPIEGYATHYAPGLFARVAHSRGLPAADCHIASDWHLLGSRVLVVGQRTGVARVAQVSDVSAPEDRARHMRNGLFELSYQCARAVCGAAFGGPWRWCPVVVRAVGVSVVRGLKTE